MKELELKKLLAELAITQNGNKEQIKQLFDLHNHFYPNQKDYGMACGSCRARVYNKMIELYKIQEDERNKA